MTVNANKLSDEEVEAFAIDPSAIEDSNLLIYKDAGQAANDSLIAKKILRGLNAAVARRFSVAFSLDAKGKLVSHIFDKIAGGNDDTKQRRLKHSRVSLSNIL